MCLDLEIRRVYHQNESDFGLQGPEGQNFVKIPSGNFQNGSEVVMGVLYKSLSKMILIDDIYTKEATNKSRPQTGKETACFGTHQTAAR